MRLIDWNDTKICKSLKLTRVKLTEYLGKLYAHRFMCTHTYINTCPYTHTRECTCAKTQLQLWSCKRHYWRAITARPCRGTSCIQFSVCVCDTQCGSRQGRWHRSTKRPGKEFNSNQKETWPSPWLLGDHALGRWSLEEVIWLLEGHGSLMWSNYESNNMVLTLKYHFDL